MILTLVVVKYRALQDSYSILALKYMPQHNVSNYSGLDRLLLPTISCLPQGLWEEPLVIGTVLVYGGIAGAD